MVVREVTASFNVDRVFICDDEEVTVTANNSSSFGPLSYDWSAATNVTPVLQLMNCLERSCLMMKEIIPLH